MPLSPAKRDYRPACHKDTASWCLPRSPFSSRQGNHVAIAICRNVNITLPPLSTAYMNDASSQLPRPTSSETRQPRRRRHLFRHGPVHFVSSCTRRVLQTAAFLGLTLEGFD
ncbi:hypothetical protein BS78_09G239100 [Paspalum vaginatum]|nr:hypothetical protein BS78_09G239100 [Paspalum vaginatum]